MAPRDSNSHSVTSHVTHKSSLAILLIDVINDFDFPGSEPLVEHAKAMAKEISALCRLARRRDVPIIYANDNFGRWRSDFQDIARYCSEKKGREVVRMLLPHQRDYFVLKPKNSAFYTTTLDLLLRDIGVRRLVLTGVLADNCVLFTANDAYMRGYKIVAPSDCVASVEEWHRERALQQMKRVLKADTRPWRSSVRIGTDAKSKNPPAGAT